MGSVCHTQSNQKENLNDIKFGQQTINFKIGISNIKAKNLQHFSSYVQIKIKDQVLKTSLIRYTKNPHWPNDFNIDLAISPYQMNTTYFYLQIIDDAEKVHYKLKYSLQEIATYPAHHDIMFSNKASLIFDLKVAQRVQFKIMTKYITVSLFEQLAEVAYSFKLKIKTHELEKNSDLSPNYVNPTYLKDDQEDSQFYKYGQKSVVNSMKHVSTKKALEAKKDLSWEFKVEESPQLEFDIYTTDFSTTTIIFLLYAKKSNKDQPVVIQDSIYKRVGNTYVSFNKLWSDNTSVIAQTDNIIISESTLRVPVYANGANIGIWKGQFLIKSNQYVQQQSGIRTQDGIVYQSALLLKKAKVLKNGDSKEIDWLIELQIKLEQLLYQIRDKKIRDSERLKNEIQVTITEASNSKLRLYQSEEEMLHCQELLIKLWKYLLEQSDKQAEQVKELFYTVLGQLIFREDMDLDYLSIDTREERLHVSQQYLQLLIRTIPLCLSKVVDSSCSEREHEFFVKFAVLVFFRIPKFREDLFQVPKEKEEHRFFQWVFQNEKGTLLKQEMNELNISLSEDFTYFLYPFVIKWCDYILKKHGQNVDWESIVGYHQVVESLLSQMQTQNALFIEASCTLLSNPMLLSRFLQITYNSTRIYDALQVFNTFTIIDVWLQYINKQDQRLPTNFDYHFFLNGVFCILQGDHAVSISKCLQLIYNNFPLLPSDPKKDLCEYLFSSDIFFKLMLHWSLSVRISFMYLLIYRIQHRHKSLKSGYEKLRDINKELQYAFQKVYPQQEKQNLINDMIYLKYSQLIQLIKKINKKFLTFEKYRGNVVKLVQEKSLRVKLQKKIQHSQQQRSDIPDLMFQSQISQALSARRYQDIPNNSLKSLDTTHKEQQEFFVQNPDQYCESFGSFIDLNEIIKEVEEEQLKQKKVQPSSAIGKMKSYEQNQKMDPKIITGKIKDFDIDLSKLDPQLLKYLPQAYQEWVKIQGEYQKWVQQMKIKFNNQNIQDKILDSPVPILKVIIPRDQSNQEAQEDSQEEIN